MESIFLSYVSQYGYCPRRAGLLLLEQAWEENEYTASGRAEHNRVHDAHIERRGDHLTLLDYPVSSELLGLSGKCDSIEASADEGGSKLPFEKRRFRLYPIEYKHGVIRDEPEYHLQLCAQAMCLEEMYGGCIEKGAIFFIDAHRRDEVELDEMLRKEVIAVANALHEMLDSERIPMPYGGLKCRKCSLLDVCSPSLKHRANDYCQTMLKQMEEPEI